MLNTPKKKYLDLIFYSFLTYLALTAIYPERFIFAEIRFTSSHTIGNFYQAALFHAKYIANLNFTFWNFFDHSNTAFYHLAQGFYNLPALIEGLIYNFLSFFKSENFFRVFHSYFVQFFFIVVRTFGIILILEIYKAQKFVYLPSILFINILISSIISLGYELGWLLSITPILIYYLIKFLKTNNIVPLVFFLIFYVFIFSQIPLISLSYFFPLFHFIVTMYFIVMLYNYFFKKSYFQLHYKNFLTVNLNFSYHYFLLFLSLLVIIIFNISFFLIVDETSALTGSIGYDGSRVSRFDNILNPINFFKTYIPNTRCIYEYEKGIPVLSECSTFNMLSYFLNFKENIWYGAPAFIGSSVVLVSLFGLVFSEHKEKWYFFSAIIFVIAMQGPRDILFFDINFYANLFTAFLNPFAFLIQNTHMMILVLPFLLIPLFVMGVISISHKIKSNKLLLRKVLFLFVFIIILLYLLTKENINYEVSLIYCVISSFLFLIFYLNQNLNFHNKKISLILILSCFLLDGYALKSYYKAMSKDDILIDGHYSGAKLFKVYVSGKQTYIKHDIENRNPLNSSLSIELIKIKPTLRLNEKKDDDSDFIFNKSYFPKQLYVGEINKTNSIFQNLQDKPDVYEIRHKAYATLDKVKDTEYFKDDLFLVSFFNKFTNSQDTKLKDFFNDQNLFRNTIYLSGYKKFENNKNENVDREYFENKTINIENKDLILVKKTNKQKLYKFKKPKEFPNYINGTIFSNLDLIKLEINGKEFNLTHNDLHLDNTFVLDSIENGFIHFMTEQEFDPKKIDLIFKKYTLVNNLNRKADNFIFDLDIKENGWLLLKFPYDKNWEVFIDGKKTKVFKANEFWLGAKVEKNNKFIEVKYSLNKYLMNQIFLIFYYISMIFILVFLYKFNFLIKKNN